MKFSMCQCGPGKLTVLGRPKWVRLLFPNRRFFECQQCGKLQLLAVAPGGFVPVEAYQWQPAGDGLLVIRIRREDGPSLERLLSSLPGIAFRHDGDPVTRNYVVTGPRESVEAARVRVDEWESEVESGHAW